MKQNYKIDYASYKLLKMIKSFPFIDMKKFHNKDEVEAITFSMTEDYINKIQKL